MGMFGNKVETTEVVAEKVVKALTVNSENLTKRRDEAISGFRFAANELAEVNIGLAENAALAKKMADFFNDCVEGANKQISDNDAVRKRILEIIGE